MSRHPKKPTLFINSSDRVGYDENKFVETENYLYTVYLDNEMYNNLIRYNKDLTSYDVVKLEKAKDNHGQLDILLDSNGIIHLIGGGHTDENNFYYRQNTKDSLTFTKTQITKYMTYPKMFEYNKNLYIFYREGIEKNTNYDRWSLLKKDLTSTTLNFATQEVITVVGDGTFMGGYGNTSNLINNKLYISLNWYNSTIDTSDEGFIIYKDLNSGYWYNTNNTQISLPINRNTIHITGKDFRQNAIISCLSESFIFTTSIVNNEINIYKINNGVVKVNNNLPSNDYINGVKVYNNKIYILTTNKTTKNIYLYEIENNDFNKYKTSLIGNCGYSYYWSSATLNILNGKYYIRILKNKGNLEIIKGVL